MKPNIFTYEDYREFLKDLYKHLKETKPSFSHRYFSKKAGFVAPNFLQLVMQGKRNLTVSSIPKFAKALSLNNQETEFFEHLVHFNQATAPEEKTTHYERMSRCRRYREINELDKEIMQFYSKWFHVVIREMVTLNHFQADPDWIAKNLLPHITPKEAERALKLLLKLKLLKREGEQPLEQADPIVSTAPEVRSLAVTNFHQQMLKMASSALVDTPSEQRDITSATVGISEAQLPVLKQKIERFRKELLTSISSSKTPTDRIYQLNIQLFPLTQKKGSKS